MIDGIAMWRGALDSFDDQPSAAAAITAQCVHECHFIRVALGGLNTLSTKDYQHKKARGTRVPAGFPLGVATEVAGQGVINENLLYGRCKTGVWSRPRQ